jgi:hypothetical protein
MDDTLVWNLAVVNKIRFGIHVEILPWIVEIKEESQQTAVVFYMCLSVVLWKEKLWWALWHSYDGVSDGHFVAIHRVGKFWTKKLFSSFSSSLRLNTSGRYLRSDEHD